MLSRLREFRLLLLPWVQGLGLQSWDRRLPGSPGTAKGTRRQFLDHHKQKPSVLCSSWVIPRDADLSKKKHLPQTHGHSQTQGTPWFASSQTEMPHTEYTLRKHSPVR